jgi:hypothetical protein
LDIQKPDVKSLVDDISKGKVALPDFQRDFIWKADDVQDLLISIFADFYIGTMLVIDEVRDEAKFKLRLIDGVPRDTAISSIVKILLDGQQRCSSLYYALRAPSIPLAGRKNPYLFFLNLAAAERDEPDNAIETVNSGNRSSVVAASNDKGLVPLSLILEPPKLISLLQSRGQDSKIPDVVNYANQITNYQVQMVELKRETPLDRVVEVFERINRTGLPLNITDLLVARMFKSNVQLRELIEIATEVYEVFGEDNQVEVEFVLRLICLMRGQPIQKRTILELDPTNFATDWDTACAYLEKAYKRITNPLGGYGAVDFRRLVPFRTMIIPLAAMLWKIDLDNSRGKDASLRKVDQWYWASVFSNRYNEAVNTTTPADFERVCEWIADDARVPDFIDRFNIDTIDFRTSSKSSSTYRGVLNLVVLGGARDFQTGVDPLANKSILEDDHIFPKSIYRDNEIMNRTLIASNAEKSNRQPNQYFGALETLLGRERVEEILSSHLIDSNCYSALIQNDLDRFKKQREIVVRAAIKSRIPSARGLG